MKSKSLLMLPLFAISFLLLLMMPMVSAGGIMAEPAQTLGPIYLEEFGHVEYDTTDEAKHFAQLVSFSLQSSQIQEMMDRVYGNQIQKYPGVSLPMNYFIIPHILFGVEEPELTTDVVNQIASAMVESKTIIEKLDNGETKTTTKYSIVDTESYVSRLLQLSPFNQKVQLVSADKVSTWVDGLNNVYYHEGLDYELIASLNQKYLYPLKTKAIVTEEFGWYDPFNTGSLKRHWGIDLAYSNAALTCGQPIFASHDGRVDLKGNDPNDSRGFFINIKNNEVETRYYHLIASSPLAPGSNIKQGTYLGSIGNTGKSTGCHLHFEFLVKNTRVNPRTVIEFNNPILIP